METSEIIWTGSPDDQSARVGDYVLRVELMDEYWWWACFAGTEEYCGYKPTIEEAKQAAEAAYREHLNKK